MRIVLLVPLYTQCATLFHFPFFFFFNDTATTEIYTLSLHDALPIYRQRVAVAADFAERGQVRVHVHAKPRSEEHTSELQSRGHLVCRLLLEKKKPTPPNGERRSRKHHVLTQYMQTFISRATRVPRDRPRLL